MRIIPIIAILVAVFSFGAIAQQSTDQWWQQYAGAQSAWCGQQVVALAAALDDAKKQIEELKKKVK